MFGNFWQASRSGNRAATEAEAADFARPGGRLEDRAGQRWTQVVAALEAYQNDVMNQQWPLLEHADSPAAYTTLVEAGCRWRTLCSRHPRQAPTTHPSGVVDVSGG